ncbi:hypothetical protein EK904_014565 [Melospiza melodia maxima]|nr:hypothetical protein EK904_014565 [Melospiza melodia maxima]
MPSSNLRKYNCEGNLGTTSWGNMLGDLKQKNRSPARFTPSQRMEARFPTSNPLIKAAKVCGSNDSCHKMPSEIKYGAQIMTVIKRNHRTHNNGSAAQLAGC